jgi:predicted transcriptional regulator
MSDTSNLLISLHPTFADKIVSGEKTVELRRRPIRASKGSHLWLYVKSPRATIEAKAVISKTIEGSPSEIWNEYGHRCGIRREEFRAYFADADRAFAIQIGKVRCLKTALTLQDIRKVATDFQPPQFYKRLGHGSPELNLLQAAL